MLNSLNNQHLSTPEAKMMAQFIAMAPFVFQTAVSLQDLGILEALYKKPEGCTSNELQEISKLSSYSLSVLLDAGESAGMVKNENSLYFLTHIGGFLLKDPITRVNLNFTKDVCYLGLSKLKESLLSNKPEGLKFLGNWNTVYEGLSQLPEVIKKSWFDFDHFYSDDGFPRALPLLLKDKPRKILDLGGNTGKFALAATSADPEIEVTIVDLPGQVEMAKKNIQDQPHQRNRVHYHPVNLLEKDSVLPSAFDAVWMSQFLSCFSSEEIIALLQKASKALSPNGSIYILETFTDNQKFKASQFCLDMTSLYFTALANGNSRMYRSKEFYSLLHKAGLHVIEEYPCLRLNHTLLKCQTLKN